MIQYYKKERKYDKRSRKINKFYKARVYRI